MTGSYRLWIDILYPQNAKKDSVWRNCLHNQIPGIITYFFEIKSIVKYFEKPCVQIEYQNPFICELMPVKD